jgi:nucleoside-diphosphate-sugar epimerase
VKILVTGATGIVGKSVIAELLKNDSHFIVGTSRHFDKSYEDHPGSGWSKGYIECYSNLALGPPIRLIEYLKPDLIFNFAALSKSNAPANAVWENTNITLNLLESLKAAPRPYKFIQASSIVVENLPQSVYSVSKVACEALVNSYRELYPHIKTLNVRFPAVCGAGNKHGLIRDLMAKVKASPQSIEVFGNHPGSVKPFVFSKNLAEIMVSIATDDYYYKAFRRLTICPSDTLSVEGVIERIADEMKIEIPNLKWIPGAFWVGDQNNVRPNNEFVKKFFRYQLLSSGRAVRAAVRDILAETK